MSVISVRGQFLNREVSANRERAPADCGGHVVRHVGNDTPGGSCDIFAGEHAGNTARGRTGERERARDAGLFRSVSALSSRKFVRPAVRSLAPLTQPSRRIFHSDRTAAVIARVEVVYTYRRPFRAREPTVSPPIADRRVGYIHARSDIGSFNGAFPAHGARIPIS